MTPRRTGGANEGLYLDIHRERMRAHEKHFAAGKSAERMEAHDVRWLPVLTEEVGEVARALCDDGGLERLREELIQVAAMASAWIAAIDREPHQIGKRSLVGTTKGGTDQSQHSRD